MLTPEDRLDLLCCADDAEMVNEYEAARTTASLARQLREAREALRAWLADAEGVGGVSDCEHSGGCPWSETHALIDKARACLPETSE